MTVRIYRPAKNAMQSGRANARKWVLEYAATGHRQVDDLMGWTGIDSTLGQVRLRFDSKEEAVAYAARAGLEAVVTEPRERRVKPKSYADNFISKV